MRFYIPCLLLLFIGSCHVYALSLLRLNGTVDSFLTIHLHLQYITQSEHSVITGYGIYITNDTSRNNESYKSWSFIEILEYRSSMDWQLKRNRYHISKETTYKLVSSVFVNGIESTYSDVLVLDTTIAAHKAPVIKSANVLVNGSVIFDFLPAEDVPLITNYTLEYHQKDEEEEWEGVTFLSDNNNCYVLQGLEPNVSYVARLLVTGDKISGYPSKETTFRTENNAELPQLTIYPIGLVEFDPDLSSSIDINCTATANPVATITWKIDNKELLMDHSFYTIASVVNDMKTTSVIRAKSRTRSDRIKCVANNAAGYVSADVEIKIRGPGSPPSAITLTAEKGSYSVSWMPPSHPNGQIKKYVVYYSYNKDDPLSDWSKMDLDGSERKVKLFAEENDAFYVRVQAATSEGPGIISDVVAIEADTIPISIWMSGNESVILEPKENMTVSCQAKGKPKPFLHYALADTSNASTIEDDVWHPLMTLQKGDVLTSSITVSLTSSKFLHCRAKNSGGYNSTNVRFIVQKPSEPRDVSLVSQDSKETDFTWQDPAYPNLPILKYEVFLVDSSLGDNGEPLKFEVPNKVKINRISLPNLKAANQYILTVRAVNEAGHGMATSPLIFFTPKEEVPEGKPENVKVVMDEANTAVLSWTAPDQMNGVKGYIIYLTRDMGQTNVEYKEWQSYEVPSDVNRFKLDHRVDLRPKTLYRVTVAAKNEMAVGPISPIVEFETAYSPLPIATDLEVTLDEDNTVHVTFPAVRSPDDVATVIQNYRMEMLEGEHVLRGTFQVIKEDDKVLEEKMSTTMVTLTISGSKLKINEMYWMRISCEIGTPPRMGQASKPVFFRTGHGKIKTRVEIVEGRNISSEPSEEKELMVHCRAYGNPPPNVSWRWKGAEVKNGENGFRIDQNSTDKIVTSQIVRNSFVEQGELWCLAYNDEGNATEVIWVNVEGPGSPPDDITTEAYRNFINVSWSAPELPNGRILKYLIYYFTEDLEDLNEWQQLQVDGEVHSSQLLAILPRTKHLIRMQAVSEQGPGMISEPHVCHSDEKYAPLQLELNFKNLSPDDSADPRRKVFIECIASGHPKAKLDLSSEDGKLLNLEEEIDGSEENRVSMEASIMALTNTTIKCTGWNKYENTVVSRMIVVRKPGDAPTNIQWKFNEEGRLFIDWSPCKYPNGNVSYRLYLSNTKVTVSGPPVLWAKEEIPLNMELQLQISAFNEWGEGEKSPQVTVVTPNGGPQDAPNMTMTQNEDNSITVHWEPPKLPMGEIVGYKLYVEEINGSGDNKTVIQVDADVNSYIFQNIDTFFSRRVSISALNYINESVLSEPIILDYAHELPSNITATYRNDSIILQFLSSPNPFRNIMVYVKEKDSEYNKGVQIVHIQNREEVIIQRVAIDNSKQYLVKVAGLVDGKETSSSLDIPLDQPSNSDLTFDSKTQRLIVKEPPL